MSTQIVEIKEINGSDQAVTTSEVLSKQTGNEHKAILQIVRKYIKGVTFEMVPFKTNGGVQNRQIAILNEQQATFAITLFKNTEKVVDFKFKLVNEFFRMRHELEKQQQQSLPKSFADQAKALEIAAPKAIAHDRFMSANDCISMNDAAKSLGFGRNKLFAQLRNDKILMADNVPYQTFIARGYFKTVEKTNEYNDKINTVTLVTPKGVDWLSKKY